MYTHTAPGDKNSCIQTDGGTSYSQALKAGIAELNKGRNGATTPAQKVLIFMTDGSANIGPVWDCSSTTFKSVKPCDPTLTPTGIENTNPCQAAINIAAAAKASGISIYTIGYGLGDTGIEDSRCWKGIWPTSVSVTDPKTKKTTTTVTIHTTPTDATKWYSNHTPGNQCWQWATNPSVVVDITQCQESPFITPDSALQAIASGPKQYYNATTADVSPVFAAIAADIESGTSRLANPAS
jgi:hypothetical protein